MAKTLNEKYFLENCTMYNEFLAVKERLGACEKDECYTFVPIKALGGNGAIADMEIGKLKEYLSILSEVVSDRESE